MSAEHLSALQLDELASGAVDASPHLASCAECTARLQRVKAERAAFLATPQAKAFEAKLVDRHADAPPLPAPRRALLVLAPIAAALALFFLWPRDQADGGDRIKGGAMVLVLDARGNPVSEAQVGDEVTLALRFSGKEPRTVTVTAVDGRGSTEPLWSGVVAPNERSTPAKFVVTPGSVELVADFAPPASQALRVGAEHEIVKTRLEVK